MMVDMACSLVVEGKGRVNRCRSHADSAAEEEEEDADSAHG